MTALIIGIIIFILGMTLYRGFCQRNIAAKSGGRVKLSVGASAGGAMIGGIAAGAFGAWSLIVIPIICVLCGCAHNYFCGVIAYRSGGVSMHKVTERFLGKKTGILYGAVTMLLMAAGCALFVKISAQCIEGIIRIAAPNANIGNTVIWTAAAVSFIAAAAVSRINKKALTDRISSVCLILLLASAAALLITAFMKSGNIGSLGRSFSFNLSGLTAAAVCTMLSGFNAAVGCKDIESESECRDKFFTSMLLQGVIAEAWAAAVIAGDIGTASTPAQIISSVTSSKIVGAVVLAISCIAGIYSAAQAIGGADRVISDITGTKREDYSIRRFAVALILTAAVSCAAIIDSHSFVITVFIAVDAVAALIHFAAVTAYMTAKKRLPFIPMASGVFYIYMTAAYFANSSMGLNISSMRVCYTIALVLAILYAAVVAAAASAAENKNKADGIL